MTTFKSVFDEIDISTRPKRRRAVHMIHAALKQIRSAEIAYMEKIPENLQVGDAYANADESVEVLTDVIDALMDAY